MAGVSQMGFTIDPGPLPFVTVRDVKWANRLAYLPMPLRIHGEHGCSMPRGIASAVRVEPTESGAGPYPDSRRLVKVYLEKPASCPVVHAWDREWGMCAHCGEPIQEN